jgi:sugar/nucleoside kinase (ribokinase family)
VTKAPLVLLVGDIMNDVVVRPRAAIDLATDTPSRIEFSRGGSAANQAAWMAALGANVRFAGRAGAVDAAGHELALASLGVDVRLTVDTVAPTGTVVAVVAAGGERSMFTDRGANRNLARGDLEGLLDGVSLLHISAYQLFEPLSRDSVRALWDAAVRSGVATSVDPASFAGIRDCGREQFLEWTSGGKFVFPNFEEGRNLTGELDPEAIVSALLESYAVVALKLGSDGTLTGTADGARVRKSAEAADVVDSTGAGDAFCAGFLVRFVAGGGLEESTAFAVRVATEVLSRSGGRPLPGEPPLG